MPSKKFFLLISLILKKNQTDVKLVTLDRLAFKRLLGPIDVQKLIFTIYLNKKPNSFKKLISTDF